MKIILHILLLLSASLFASVAAAQTYRIGVLVPLSGSKADKGIPMKNAIELFATKFNATSNDTQLELVFKDDFDDPQKAVAAAKELVQDKSLLAVIGHYYPTTALATAKVFADAKIPFISPNVSTPDFTQSSPWMFSMNVPDDVQGCFIAVYIKEILKQDNIVLIHHIGPMGIAMRDAFMQKARNIGLNVIKSLPFDRNQAMPANWVAQHFVDPKENAKMGMIVALTRSDFGLAFLPQLREYGITAPVIAPSAWGHPKFASDLPEQYTENLYVTSAFLWEMGNHQTITFFHDYQKQYHQAPIISAAMSFDALFLLTQAIQTLQARPEHPVVNRANVRDYLAKLDWQTGLEGVTGILFFNNARDKTAQYIQQYNALQESLASAPISGVPPVLKLKQPIAAEVGCKETRSLLRDVFVSTIKEGKLQPAPLQLVHPREEYVLKQLPARVQSGAIKIVDQVPYHLVDVVFVGVDVIRINDINIKDMTWDVDVFMWFKWADGRLDDKEIEKIVAINALKEQSTLLMEDLTLPMHYRVYRKRLTLSSPFDLAAFPFDAQTLPLSIAHSNKISTRLMLVPDFQHLDQTVVAEIKPPEWIYLGREMFSDFYRYSSTFGNPNYRSKDYKSPIYFSSMDVKISIKRILTPYLYTFFLPLIILLGIILLVLWVPLDQFSPRIGAAISGMVGVLVYHMSQKNAFPKVGYTMIADYYFLITYVFIVMLIICIIYLQTLMSKGEKELAKIWNRRFSIAAMIAAPGLYALLTTMAWFL